MKNISRCACFLAIVMAASAQDRAVVDAVVTGKAGVVKGLAAKDFKVLIDNKEQPVTAATLLGPGKHAVVLLFDSTTLTAGQQSDIRTWVAKFIDSSASPNLFMEVATFRAGIEVVQPFTTDAAALKASLTATAASTVVASAAPSTTAGARATRQTSLGSVAPSSDRTMQSQEMMDSLRGLVETLAPVQGRKAILVFTGGQQFSQDATTQVDAAIDAANKANVAIYGISNNTAYAKTFADGTGGSAVRPTQQLPEALQQIIQEQDAYYAVAFTPASGTPAGACHSLKLKVDGDGNDVRSQKLYCPGKRADALEGTPAGSQLTTILAGTANGTLNVSVQAPWFYRTKATQAGVKVVIDAPSSGLKFQKVKGKMHGELNTAGAAYAADGSVAARFSETLPYDFSDQKQADAFLKQPFHYENQIELPSGKYTVKAVISAAADVFGKAETTIAVGTYDPAKLGMSGIALSRQLLNAPGAGVGLPADMLEGPTPLMASGRQIVPTAVPRFQTTERALFYAEIYEPALAGNATPGVSMQFRVLDRVSRAVKSDSGVASVAGYIKPGNPVIGVASTVPGAQLPPGAYTLEITASHTTGPDTVTRAVDFDLN